MPDTDRVRTIRRGLYLGELRKNRFEPSQAWAMTLRPESADGALQEGTAAVTRMLSLSEEDPRLQKYLTGESFDAGDAEDGWTLVCAGKYPVGWAKVVRGTAKNHYPPSWRISG